MSRVVPVGWHSAPVVNANANYGEEMINLLTKPPTIQLSQRITKLWRPAVPYDRRSLKIRRIHSRKRPINQPDLSSTIQNDIPWMKQQHKS
jgi:hypothetical protein